MIEFKGKTVLILAPHTDDGELGVGGTIVKMIEDGAEVYYAAFSTAEKSVPNGLPKGILKKEVREATSLLGIDEDHLILFNYEVRKLNYVRQEILEELIKIRKEISPDIVFIPSLRDIHQDHSTIANEGVRTFKYSSILSYELIWNNISFDTQAFVKLDDKHIDLKVEALSKYQSQAGRDYMSPEFIRALAHTRGVQIGAKNAEVFEVVRMVV